MKLLFIGNLTGVGSTGEQADEVHISRCIEQTGIDITKVDRAEIHAFFTGAKQDNIPPADKYDFIILCKWHHFTEPIIKGLKERYQGKLVYWVWDWMQKNGFLPDWHTMILGKCDIYLSGELFMREHHKLYQYFNWDTSDGQYDQLPRDEKYDVVFTGSYINGSYRNDILKKVNEKFNLTIFSHDFEEWKRQGFKAEQGKYAGDFNQLSAQSKVMLCMNWIAPNKETTGYQSNRIGKIVTTGGLPLVHYFPLAEQMMGDNVPFFYNETDLMPKIQWFLDNPPQRETARVKAYDWGRREMTTQVSMRRLKIILESYL